MAEVPSYVVTEFDNFNRKAVQSAFLETTEKI